MTASGVGDRVSSAPGVLPRFSVLLPYHHGVNPSHLRVALHSVTTAQELLPDEVVLVQDGPVAAALEVVVDEFMRDAACAVEIVRLGRNGGLGPALNAGLVCCTHDIVARMDADDIALPSRFAVQIPLIAGGLDVLGAGLCEFGEEADPDVGTRVPPTDPERIAADARFHQTFFHPTVVYRRDLVCAVGGYEPFPHLEDYLLFARLLMAGARVGNVAQPLVRYRIGAGAYARRGGLSILRAEITLQLRFFEMGFTTAPQLVRNLAIRGGYRLIPETLRRVAYRRLLAHRR